MADGSPAENHSSPFPWSRPAVLVSGGFLLMLALAGILVAVVGGGHHGHRSAQRQSTPTSEPPSTTPAPANPKKTCTLSAGPQSIPSASPPAGTQWVSVGSMQAPHALRLYGPQRSAGGFDTCFAHSPAGALLAAINLWAESTAALPSQVFAKLAIGAPHHLGNNERLDANGSVQLAGYRFESYSPTRAQLSIVLRGPQGKFAAAITTMVWAARDWKYLFPPNGTPPVQVIPDLTGYVSWSAF